MPYSLLSLNFDVLSNILPLISSHDAAQLVLTSRRAYALALPRFLSDISIGGLYHDSSSSAASRLKAFCNFILAPAHSWHGHPSARLDALRSLEVMRDAVRIRKDGAWTIDVSAVALLSAVLQRAQGLQTVTLWGSDALFNAYPDFAATRCTSIQTLVLGGDIAPLPALATAFPHIRALEFIHGRGACPPEWTFSPPDASPEALGPWGRTLQRVDTGFPVLPLACPVRRVDLRNPVVPDMENLLTTREFLSKTKPVVLSASVSACSAPEEIGIVLGTAAPSLRYLNLIGDRCESVSDGCDWILTRVTQGFSLLPDLPLVGLSISVTAADAPASVALKPQDNIPSAPTQPPDLAVLARKVAENAPSLRFIAIDLSAAKDATSAERDWFRVRDIGKGVRNVVRISEEEGRVIAAKMRAFDRFD